LANLAGNATLLFAISFLKKPMEINIRKEQTTDFDQVRLINDKAFKQEAEGILIDKLRATGAFIPDLSLVAESNGQVIGHILFTHIKVVKGAKVAKSLALAPMSVLPEYQGQGIGSKLVKKGLERAKELGYASVIVLGHEHYYPKFGFQKASQWNISAPFPVPDAAFMAIALKNGGLDEVEGVVEYARPFSEM
jgi:putative acetyltransferase